jgi:uncharacterized protein
MSTKRNSVGWFEIYVQDMPRAKAFYEAMLQIQMEPLPSPAGMGGGLEMLMFPNAMEQNLPGCGGALCKMDGCESGGAGSLLYFSCEDCANEAARAGANGGTVVREKFSIGQYGFIALVMDTEGNMIGLHSMG